MKYLIGFLRFWRNFIIGDDPTIAITVLWSFVATYSFIRISIQAWYLVPIIVACLFVVLFAGSLRQYVAARKSYTAPHISSFHSIDALWMPMAAVMLIPFALFRTLSLELSIERFLLPLLAIAIIISVVTLLLAPRFKVYPALSSTAAALICLITMRLIEAPLLRFFGMVAENFFVGNIVLVIIAIMALAELVRRILRRREVTA